MCGQVRDIVVQHVCRALQCGVRSTQLIILLLFTSQRLKVPVSHSTQCRLFVSGTPPACVFVCKTYIRNSTVQQRFGLGRIFLEWGGCTTSWYSLLGISVTFCFSLLTVYPSVSVLIPQWLPLYLRFQLFYFNLYILKGKCRAQDITQVSLNLGLCNSMPPVEHFGRLEQCWSNANRDELPVSVFLNFTNT